MPDNKIIPFGKYKGQPVEILKADPQYCEWLSQQSWLGNYPVVQTLIINHFGEPAETPEHNALQALFVDAQFRTNFVVSLHGGMEAIQKDLACRRSEAITEPETKIASGKIAIEQYRKEITEHRSELAQMLPDKDEEKDDDNPDEPPSWVTRSEPEASYREYRKQGEAQANNDKRFRQIELPRLIDDKEDRITQRENEIVLWERKIQEYEESTFYIKTTVAFEVDGIDIQLDYIYGLRSPSDKEIQIACTHYSGSTYMIECKPSVGDDYPAVLRQILSVKQRCDRDWRKNQWEFILFIGRGGYTGTGATLDQVRAIFQSRNIKIVLQQELE